LPSDSDHLQVPTRWHCTIEDSSFDAHYECLLSFFYLKSHFSHAGILTCVFVARAKKGFHNWLKTFLLNLNNKNLRIGYANVENGMHQW
jgi:hypothetical protein